MTRNAETMTLSLWVIGTGLLMAFMDTSNGRFQSSNRAAALLKCVWRH
jgi:hypothetical protein